MRTAPSSASAKWQALVRVTSWNANRFVRSHKIASGYAGVRPPALCTVHRKDSQEKIRKSVGWVERSETHHLSPSHGGFRFALPTLRTTFSSAVAGWPARAFCKCPKLSWRRDGSYRL